MVIKFIDKEIKRLFKSEFGKNILTMFSGIGFSQLIPIIIAPILTRLYTPEEFGLLALFTSTALIFGNISTMQYDSAIMLPEKDEDAINLMALAFLSVIGITLLALITVFFFNPLLCRLMDNEDIGFWLYFVPLVVFLTGLFRILNIWASRMKQFKRLALRNITQSTTSAGTKLGVGFLSKLNGLIIGSIVGQFIATLMLLYQTIVNDRLKFSDISKKGILYIAIKYKEFPIYTNFQGFFDTFKSTGITYIISNFYGAAILGGYSFTMSLLSKPTQVIGGSISQVYYQKATEIYKSNGDLWGLTKKLMFRLLIVGIIIYMPILLFGQEIFNLVFGSNWETAGLYAQIMVPWIISAFLLQFSTVIPQIVNKQKVFFFIGIIFNFLFLAIVLLLSLLKISFPIVLSSMTFLMMGLISYLFIWFRRITSEKSLNTNSYEIYR